jgi:hypothetical protein
MASHGESARIRGRQFGGSNEESPLGLPRGLGRAFVFGRWLSPARGFTGCTQAVRERSAARSLCPEVRPRKAVKGPQDAPLVSRLHEVPRATVAREACAVRARPPVETAVPHDGAPTMPEIPA